MAVAIKARKGLELEVSDLQTQVDDTTRAKHEVRDLKENVLFNVFKQCCMRIKYATDSKVLYKCSNMTPSNNHENWILGFPISLRANFTWCLDIFWFSKKSFS